MSLTINVEEPRIFDSRGRAQGGILYAADEFFTVILGG